MVYLRTKLRCSYSQARRLSVTYSMWRGLAALSTVGSCPRNTRSQVCLISGEQHDSIPHSRLLVPHLHGMPLMYMQTRSISMETYEKYFSPDSWPIAAAMQFLESVHDLTGLPWYISIGICTVILRIGVGLPLRVVSKRNAGRNRALIGYRQALMESITAQVKEEAKKRNWSDEEAVRVVGSQINHTMDTVRKGSNSHPMKTILYPLLQVPLWVCMSLGLRNLAGYKIFGVDAILQRPEMIDEGALWFSNLLVPDPTLILPLTIGALHLLNNEINVYAMPGDGAGAKIAKWLGRGLALIFIPFATIFPSAISVYWMYSAFSATIVSILLVWQPSQKILKVEKPKQAIEYYRFYRAQLEKETGIVALSAFDTQRLAQQVGTGKQSVDSEDNKASEQTESSEHMEGSEVTRTGECKEFSETRSSRA